MALGTFKAHASQVLRKPRKMQRPIAITQQGITDHLLDGEARLQFRSDLPAARPPAAVPRQGRWRGPQLPAAACRSGSQQGAWRKSPAGQAVQDGLR